MITSKSLLNLAIEDLKQKENALFTQHLNSIRSFLKHTKNENKKRALLDKLSSVEAKFRHKDVEKRIKQAQWVKEPQKTQQKQDHSKKSKTVEKPKRKKHRRFVKRNIWKKIQDKKKMQPISAIYNYSSLTITSGMTKVLNRGLNFCVTPSALNITEILVDYRKF